MGLNEFFMDWKGRLGSLGTIYMAGNLELASTWAVALVASEKGTEGGRDVLPCMLQSLALKTLIKAANFT